MDREDLAWAVCWLVLGAVLCFLTLLLNSCSVQNNTCEIMLSECERGLRDMQRMLGRDGELDPALTHCVCLAMVDHGSEDGGCE